MYNFIYIFINIIIVKSYVINENIHLNNTFIQNICKNISNICKINHTNVCAVRKMNNKFEYKDFNNSCYLFLSNMCLYPGQEYSIAQSGDCNTYLINRRNSDNVTDFVTEIDQNVETNGTTKPALRGFSFSTLYDVETSFDLHICPPSCPNIYSPICINANRGFGKYFKFWTFVNHCYGDMYYCKHWDEFSPPEDEDEMVNSSPLAWSFCGASRYLQFARFAEATSAMGHYGWLEGDYKYSKIIDPHMRKPGYG